MTGDAGPATASGVAPAVYEFHIAGTIGPVVRSALPEFAAVVVPRFTVLTGTVPGPGDLQRLLDALDAHDSPAVDVRLTGDTAPRCHAALPVTAVNPAALRRRPDGRPSPGMKDPRLFPADPIGAD